MSIEIIDILKPKNGLSFKLIEDIDIAVTGYTSLADAVSHFATKEGMISAINTALSGKQDTLTTPQLTAVNSGITAALVAQIGTNTTAIAGKASQSDLNTTNATVATKANASDVAVATTNLQSQIDALITPVTQDAEVENARVDSDGTSHVTLKARIDSSDEKTGISFREITELKNIILKKSELKKGSLQTSTVTIDSTSLNAFAYLKKIRLDPKKKMQIVIPPISGTYYKYRYGYYDIDGVYSTQTASTTSNIITQKNNCYYVTVGVFCYNSSDDSNHNNAYDEFLDTDTFRFEYLDTFERCAPVSIVEKVNEIKQETDLLNTYIEPTVTWSNGYIAGGTGTINNSSASIYSQPIQLTAGQSVEVTTGNSNIVVIGSTTKDSLSIGDTVTPIYKTPSTSNEVRTYKYIATSSIKITVCVKASNYSLKFGVFDAYTDFIVNNKEKEKREYLLNTARFKAANPLTLVHLSDIHGYDKVLENVVADAQNYVSAEFDIICTGDLVSNTATSITSWWQPVVLTCIGNHDSALPLPADQGYYDWTGLSMADRDSYYIAPFESNWNIIHTSGTSYYYKDYANSKVRLIVLDAMLYVGDATTAEATVQTTWLSNLLDDAITNSMHVIIATHAPYAGAIAVQCSFTTYGLTVHPYEADCTLPQDIIDLVSTKQANGLIFVGYIVGHTHRDAVWDCKGDGTQIAFCITKAGADKSYNVADQYRDQNTANAYNVLTIDTTNKLIKIIRAGGANLDMYFRSRETLCWDYNNGVLISSN